MKKGIQYVALMLSFFMLIQVALGNPVFAAEDISIEDTSFGNDGFENVMTEEPGLDAALEESGVEAKEESGEINTNKEEFADGETAVTDDHEETIDGSSNIEHSEIDAYDSGNDMDEEKPDDTEYSDDTGEAFETGEDAFFNPVNELELEDGNGAGADYSETSQYNENQEIDEDNRADSSNTIDDLGEIPYVDEETDISSTSGDDIEDDGEENIGFELPDRESDSDLTNTPDNETKNNDYEIVNTELTDGGSGFSNDAGQDETVSEEIKLSDENDFGPIELNVGASTEITSGYVDQISTYFHDESDYYESIESVETSDSSIFTVDFEGHHINLLGKKPGNAVLTVRGNYGTVIEETVKVTSFLSSNKASFDAGTKKSIDFLYLDENTVIYKASSSDNTIVKAYIKSEDYYGNTINTLVMEGVKPGNANVTVKNDANNAISTVAVTVKNPPFKMSKEAVSVTAKKNCTLKSTGSKIYNALSSDKNIVTVEKTSDNAIKINALKPGKATVTVSNAYGTTSTIDVTVTKPSFSINRTSITLKASETYTLVASGSEIAEVSSSNSKVLTVKKSSKKEVLIKPVNTGNAVVTVKDIFGTIRKATVKVTSFLKISKLDLTAGNAKYFDRDEFCSYEDWTPTFSTSNSKVAIVKCDDHFKNTSYYDKVYLFIGKYPGKATINVKCSRTGVSVPITVTVKAPSFNLSSSKVIIDKVKTYSVTASGSDINKVSSSNTKIVKPEMTSSRKVKFTPVKPGTATVTFTSKYGVKRNVTVTVSRKYFNALLTSKTKTGTQAYGATEIKGKTAPTATVSTSISGKKYSVKANSKGEYVLKNIPILKVGTKINLTFNLQGVSIKRTVTVGKGNSSVRTSKYIYKYSTQVPVEIKNVHSGDKVVMSVNGKLYSRTFKGSYPKIAVNFTIKKPEKYGFRMVVKLKNKFNQDLAFQYNNVYYGNTVHIGDTKAKVKWITGWNNPEEIDYDPSEEWWWYDFNGDGSTDGCLVFDKNGKVKYWSRHED